VRRAEKVVAALPNSGRHSCKIVALTKDADTDLAARRIKLKRELRNGIAEIERGMGVFVNERAVMWKRLESALNDWMLARNAANVWSAEASNTARRDSSRVSNNLDCLTSFISAGKVVAATRRGVDLSGRRILRARQLQGVRFVRFPNID
jgi:hypothetical protein